MAQLPPITTIKREDFPDEAWTERLLWPLNRFMGSIYTALNRDLTFSENMRATVREITFTYSTAILPIKFQWPLVNKPTDVWVSNVVPVGGAPDLTQACGVQWTFNGTQVEIVKIFGLTSSNKYTVRFIIASN